jgi:hypothetical protein
VATASSAEAAYSLFDARRLGFIESRHALVLESDYLELLKSLKAMLRTLSHVDD